MAYTKTYKQATGWGLGIGITAILAGFFFIIAHIISPDEWRSVSLYCGIADLIIGLSNLAFWYFRYFRLRQNYRIKDTKP